MRLFPVLSMAAILGSCGDEPLDTCIKDEVTIDQGVYGQIVNSCDTEDCSMTLAVNREIRVYDKDPTPPDQPKEWGLSDQQTTMTPLDKTRSSDTGFYQLSLAHGVYYICAIQCERVEVTAWEPLIRWDCCSAPAGNWWRAAECSTP